MKNLAGNGEHVAVCSGYLTEAPVKANVSNDGNIIKKSCAQKPILCDLLEKKCWFPS